MEHAQQVLQSLMDYLHDHVTKILTGFILMGVGWYFGNWRARSRWQKREFYNRINISLNYIRNGKLIIRTLMEDTCQEIFLNEVAVQKAAGETTAENAILPLPKEDCWYYLNSVLNALSEQFAVGYLTEDMGIPIVSKKYIVCLTSESDGALRMRKVRAMVVRQELLTNLAAEIPAVTEQHHQTRVRTLRQLAVEYTKNPWKFIEVELSLPR